MLNLKLTGYVLSILLIIIIFLRMPQENAGLESFASKSNILGSPSSARKILNLITWGGIVCYLTIAVSLNIIN